MITTSPSAKPRWSLRCAVTTVLVAAGLSTAGLVLAAGTAQADPVDDHCSSRSGCYHGPGMRWCPGDYVWPGLVATGWDLNVCHVYHEECPPGYVASPPAGVAPAMARVRQPLRRAAREAT